MRLGTGTIKNYRRAARQVCQGQERNVAVKGCLELVERLERQNVPEFNDLMLPVKRGQTAHLLAVLALQNEVHIVLPVCPPPAIAGYDFKPTITAEAAAGIRAAKVLSTVLAPHLGVTIQPLILLADTETDLEPIMTRAGGVDQYLTVCQNSALLIAAQARSTAKVSTFSHYFGQHLTPGDSYHNRQYASEHTIRERMVGDSAFNDSMQLMSRQRADKHRLILGRNEQGSELAVRYAAQYMALGDYVRATEDIDMICNYPTPNNRFYNEVGKSSLAIFESRIERRYYD